MKKVITLLVVLGAIASANAQTSQEESRRIILGKQDGSTTDRRTSSGGSRDIILGGGDRRVYDERDTRYPSGNYPYSSREARIDQVNREYNAKIQSIRNNRYLSAAEKERMIRQLEADRARRIRQINEQYRSRDRRYDNDDDDRYDNKKYKKDNGNHYGWEKGKGNPHRSDGGYHAKGKGKGKH